MNRNLQDEPDQQPITESPVVVPAEPDLLFEDVVEIDSPPTEQPAPVPLARPDGTGRSVLVIAYYFPPMGLSGVVRISKFVKYLREFGWQPTILTVGDVGYFAHDYALLEEVEASGVEIIRTKTLDPLKIAGRKKKELKMPSDRLQRFLRGVTHTFLQPDNKIGWKKHAVAAGMKLLEERQFDVIFSTAPPFTDFLIAHELHLKSGVPFVVDYRDPWLENRHYFYATPLHKRYAAQLEESILKSTENVVVVNRRIKELLIARWPFLTHENVHIIPSGYDPSDMEQANPGRVRSRKMRFLFSGIFHPKMSPRPFYAAISKIFARFPESRDEIELVFLGTFRESYRKMAVKMGVSNSIVTPGYVEHREVMDWLMSSDVLWLTLSDPTLTPGKVYEYMGTRKPILALAPDGVTRRLLDEYGAALYADPTNVAAITEAIESLYEGWKNDSLPEGNEGTSDEYNAVNLTGQLARLLWHSMRI